MSDVRKTVIVGAGCAGYTAAIYAARANLSPLLLTGTDIGGQLTKTSKVENYPGFRAGVMGGDLMGDMLEQAQWCGAEIMYESATAIEGEAPEFVVKTDGGQEIKTRSIIWATGAQHRHLDVKGEYEYQAKQGPSHEVWGHGVTYCAVCDGAFFRKQDVVVVGGGDSAMEEANYLANLCKTVTIIHRREGFRASAAMLERAKSKENIKWELNQVVEEILGNEAPENKDREVTAIRLKSTVDGSIKDVPCKGVFVAIGLVPTTKLLEGIVEMDDAGYIKLAHGQMTSKEGLFTAGDCHDSHYRQAVTAAGYGCMAALDVERWLGRKGL